MNIFSIVNLIIKTRLNEPFKGGKFKKKQKTKTYLMLFFENNELLVFINLHWKHTKTKQKSITKSASISEWEIPRSWSNLFLSLCLVIFGVLPLCWESLSCKHAANPIQQKWHSEPDRVEDKAFRLYSSPPRCSQRGFNTFRFNFFLHPPQHTKR